MQKPGLSFLSTCDISSQCVLGNGIVPWWNCTCETQGLGTVCTPRRGQYKQSELGAVGLTQSEYMPQCTGRGVRLLRNRRFPHFRPHRRLSILQLCHFDDNRIVVEGATLVMEREEQINIRFMEKLE